MLSGIGFVEKPTQYGGLLAQPRRPSGMCGGRQLRCHRESFVGLRPHDVNDMAFTELSSRHFGGTGPDRQLLNGQSACLGGIRRYRLGIVQCGKR